MILTLREEREAVGGRKALRAVLIRLGSPRFGPPDEDVEARLRRIDDLPRLRAMALAAARTQTWTAADTLNWLLAQEDLHHLRNLLEAAVSARSWDELLAAAE
jgi:hypothetical protein